MGITATTQEERETQLWDVLRIQVRNYLESRAARLRAAGLEVEVDVQIGPPAELIVDIAEIERAMLIIMATHGYSGLRRWTVGSVTDKVVRHTRIPVFIVRSSKEIPTHPLALKRIMVPLDGSAFARKALPFAIDLATQAQAELLLLHALIPTSEIYPGISLLGPHMREQASVLANEQEKAAQMLRTLADELRPSNIAISMVMHVGYPAEVIVEEATHRHADVIVMATHGYSGLQRCALGSIADKVFHATTTPLVLIRVGEHDD